MPMEIPALPPPVGFQLVRDPSTGQFLFLPTTTTIGKKNWTKIRFIHTTKERNKKICIQNECLNFSGEMEILLVAECFYHKYICYSLRFIQFGFEFYLFSS